MTRSEQKKRAIIEAAKTEFIENGFAAANMNNVSAAAEVSKRTLYRHFESKEMLFEAVLSIVQEEIERKGDYPYHPEQSLDEQLTAITHREIEVLYQNYGIAFSRTIVMEFFRQPELAKSVSQRLYRTRAVNGWFEQAIADGKFVAQDAQTITSVYISIFQGLLFWPQVLDLNNKPEGAELASKVDTIVSTVIKAFASNR
ncbi:TetR/AcrR family transcriptional regulator [Vibrio sp. LaRot3]|uniref:TetR/AcrR family transcriptional regulator n=1 Tax=Vibrio sp. LaRot3 TaxID=2998829 RepID=UPI0022CDF8D8|nr:TetR/AcrR family transcriptional regulator [Vibrio sp. LaRot3]MDA0147871.1 TetR/AcrR family transcriptional regulator [Vibrio sp. LaRot3]